MFRTVHLSIIRNFFILHTAMVYAIQDCWQLASSEKSPDNGQKNCPKRVEFYSQNKFEKLVFLVDFIIGIYQDWRSAERKIQSFSFLWPCIVSKVWREKNQQDATIRCLLLTSVSTCFGHHYAQLGALISQIYFWNKTLHEVRKTNKMQQLDVYY